MKQNTLIIIGVVIVFILLFAWIYLLFFGTPQDPKQVFSDLGFGGEEETGIVIPPPIEEPLPETPAERPKLRQLTTRPVVGFVEVQATTTDPVTVYYAEAGTGHIYEVDPLSGNEKRISNTTIAEASYATFSPLGDYVAVRSGHDRRANSITLGTLNKTDGSLDTETLSERIEDLKIVNDTQLLFTTRETSGLTGYVYNLKTKAKSNIFTLPFYEADIGWGDSSTSTHIAYPKPTYALEGFLYEIKSGKMKRLPLEGFGFSATANADMVLYNKISGDSTVSYVYERAQDESRALDAVVVPEKCHLPKTGLQFVCGFEATVIPYEFPDTWYRGDMSFKDSIWLLDVDSMTGEDVVNTFTESGREIDMTNLNYYPDHTSNSLYFTNKNDNTLWLYEF